MAPLFLCMYINRCAVLTFLTLEPHGHWRVVAIPVQCPDQSIHLRSSTQVNMDSLQLVCPPISPIMIDQRNATRGCMHGGNYAIKSFAKRSIAGSTMPCHSPNKSLTSKDTIWNELRHNFIQKSLNYCETVCLIPNGSNDLKRNSRKKTRKKGKQGKKPSCDTGFTEHDALPEEYAHGSSTSETRGNNKDHADRLLSSSNAPEASLPDIGAENFEEPKKSTSYIDEVDVQVYSPSLIPKFNEEKQDYFENQGQTSDTTMSVCDEVEDACCISCCDDYMHELAVVDSIMIGSNSDDKTTFVRDSKEYRKKNYRFYLSEVSSSSRNEYLPYHQNLLNDVEDKFDQTEGKSSGDQCCSGSGFQVILPGKKSKENKTVSRVSSASRYGVGNLHGRTAKENNHSVWKKVQKNNTHACNSELKKNGVRMQLDATFNDAPFLIQPNKALEDKRQAKDKVSRKLKRKGVRASKPEYNLSRKGSHSNMTKSDGCVKVGMLQDEVSKVSSHASDQIISSTISRSLYQNNHPNTGIQCSGVEHMTSESVHSIHYSLNEMEAFESVCNSTSNMSNQNIENSRRTLPKSSDSDQSVVCQLQSPMLLPHLLCNGMKQGKKEMSVGECSKQNDTSGFVMQKWIPIGLRDFGVKTSTDSSSLDPGDSTSSEDNNCTLLTLRYQDANMIDEQNKKNIEAFCSNNKTRDPNGFEFDMNRIGKAVHDACRVQLTADAIAMTTSGPIAEFERFLHFSCPIIYQSPNLACCSTRSQDQPLSKHETPNMSLECLWQWYEKHGNYGLEIRTEDYGNSKRWGNDCFAFRAYFVPYLSAIQLFRNSKRGFVNASNMVSSSEVLKAAETSRKSSNLVDLPIFSVLFPQPQKESDGSPSSNQGCLQLSSTSAQSVSTPQSADTTLYDDAELIFEYFEYEQPQQRLPLFAK